MCVLRQLLSIHQLIESMLSRSWMRRRRLTVAGWLRAKRRRATFALTLSKVLRHATLPINRFV